MVDFAAMTRATKAAKEFAEIHSLAEIEQEIDGRGGIASIYWRTYVTKLAHLYKEKENASR